jgi:hypothetical protein
VPCTLKYIVHKHVAQCSDAYCVVLVPCTMLLHAKLAWADRVLVFSGLLAAGSSGCAEVAVHRKGSSRCGCVG